MPVTAYKCSADVGVVAHALVAERTREERIDYWYDLARICVERTNHAVRFPASDTGGTLDDLIPNGAIPERSEFATACADNYRYISYHCIKLKTHIRKQLFIEAFLNLEAKHQIPRRPAGAGHIDINEEGSRARLRVDDDAYSLFSENHASRRHCGSSIGLTKFQISYNDDSAELWEEDCRDGDMGLILGKGFIAMLKVTIHHQLPVFIAEVKHPFGFDLEKSAATWTDTCKENLRITYGENEQRSWGEKENTSFQIWENDYSSLLNPGESYPIGSELYKKRV